MAREFLEKQGYQYTERNIQTDPTARQELIKMRMRGVPVLLIGDEIIPGYDPDAIIRAVESAK